MYAVELRHVKKTYHLDDVKVEVLRGVDMKIKKGEFVAIMGPSGSGKSTLLNMIGLLDKPTSGEVIVGGLKAAHLSDNELAEFRREKIGFVFQLFNLVARMTALENVTLPSWFSGHTNEEKAKNLLNEVGLADRMNSNPTQMSGGERQRVSIARALMNDPEIIIADEPTGSLDSKTGNDIIRLMKKIHDDGNTLILVTHDPDISKHAERIIRIRDGVIV